MTRGLLTWGCDVIGHWTARAFRVGVLALLPTRQHGNICTRQNTSFKPISDEIVRQGVSWQQHSAEKTRPKIIESFNLVVVVETCCIRLSRHGLMD